MTIEEQIIEKLEAETEVSREREYVDSPSSVTGNNMTGAPVDSLDIQGPTEVTVTLGLDEDIRAGVSASFNVDGHDVDFEATLEKQVGLELTYSLIY